MNKKYTFILRILLDQARPTVDLSLDWVKTRIDLFLNTTYKSLENQTYRDFKIWLFCGLKHRAFTENYSWPENIVPVYKNDNMTKDEIATIDTPYMINGRLDSDDLLRNDALEQVVKLAPAYMTHRPEFIIMKKALQYDVETCKLYFRYRDRPPFVYQILPKFCYQDIKWLSKNTYIGHGRMGGQYSHAVEMDAPYVCVIKHDDNTVKESREAWAAKEGFLTDNKETIKEIMKDFSYEIK